jgi:predicted NodU family carbamoyl transferase
MIADGNIVGWFQAMEFGPRALGNRSLLADPRRPDTQAILNRMVKHREDFRPFAPSVLAERADDGSNSARIWRATNTCCSLVRPRRDVANAFRP